MNFLPLFEESVKKNFDKVAIVDQDGTREFTYGELDKFSGQVAAKLSQAGVCPGDSVMIHMGRKSEYYFAYLGILKMGGVIVPVIEEYPEERIKYIEKDSQTRLIIRDSFFKDIEKYEPAESVILEDEALALIVYTSGSTGNPKGIEHTVKSFCDAGIRATELYRGLEKVVMTGAAPLSFVATVVEYIGTFLVGGTTHMLSDAVRKDVRALEEYYPKNKITVSFISPQLLRLFDSDSPYLKRVFAGSDRLANKYSEKYEIYNVLGMSETGATVTYFIVDKKYDNTPVGKAFEGLEILLLDEQGNEVAQGEIGEICVIGHLARGYRNLPEKTAETFKTLPDGRILLHGGDCGMLDADGNLIYLNRKDWMVKIKGQRVETPEIEANMIAMDEIANAAVKAFVDGTGQTYLVGYYVEKSPVSQEEIKRAMSAKMPSYMIPRFFKKLAAMPINVNGKLDRKALLPPSINEYKAEYVAPADELEAAICKGFEDILMCGKIGACDDYVRLGGDSIRVARLAALLSEYKITPAMILRGRTPRGIAEISRKAKGLVIEHQTELKDSYPLTDAQLGVYLDCINNPGRKTYNIPIAFKLPEKIDLERFAAAVKTVISAHKAFNVTAKIVGDAPAMVLCEREPEIIRKQAASLTEEKQVFVQPFDIEQGPLYRMELCEVRNEKYFLFDVHHLVFDGSSISVFIDDIVSVYQGGQPKEEKLSLFDLSVFEETLKETDAYKEAQAYFEEKLAGIDGDSSLYADFAPEDPAGTAKRLLISTHEAVSSEEIEMFAKRAEVTESTLFLGAFAYALATSVGQEECFFCTVNNGRHDDRLADATGMFVKTLPMHVAIDEDLPPAEYLQNMQDDLFEAMEHDCISFGELAAKYQLTPSMTFVYQGEMLTGPELCGEKLSADFLETGDAQFDLNVMVVKNNGGYEFLVTYKDELYQAETIRNFADLMLMIVKGLIAENTMGEITLFDD